MSEPPSENEIDKIFRNGIEPVSTEPSDEFWRKAAEDVISRGSKFNENKATRWRTIAIILAALILLLGFFTVRMQNGLNKVEQQVAEVTKLQSQPPGYPSGKTEKINSITGSNNNPDKSIAKHVGMQENITSPKESKQASEHNRAVNNSSVNRMHRKNNNGALANETRRQNIIAFSENNRANAEEPFQVTAINPIETKQQFIPSLTDSTVNRTIPEIIVSSNEVTIATPSKFSLSAFFSPDFSMGYKFKSNESYGSQVESAIKTDEKQSFSYTAGAKVEYRLCPRFAISAGIGYETFSFNYNPGIIYAGKQSDGDIGYYFTTSSGLVECPYYGPANIGDSLKMNASSTRNYLEIPVSVKYAVINKAKYNIYITGAIETNISIGESTTMNWQDYWGYYGVAIVNNTQGSESVFFSYYAGAGADFKIGKYLSVYAEPGLHNALTSIDNDTPVVSYPRLFSFTAGLTWYLK